MTLYLTEATPPEEIAVAKASGLVHAIKYYPAGATTHSTLGVREMRRCYPVFEAMQLHGMPLLLHGEVTDPSVDIFDRENEFIDRHLIPLQREFPGLRIVFEHITTREAVEFVRAATANLAATITAHHLLLNRNAMFSGGFRPHHYCLPLLKRETHRQALVSAATSGDPKFFLGTDSAPHPRHAKESDCGCAGIYTAHAALELYAEVFESVGALNRLEGFACFYGADFYGLPRNGGKLTMLRESWTAPREIHLGEHSLIPFRAGEPITWKLVDVRE